MERWRVGSLALNARAGRPRPTWTKTSGWPGSDPQLALTLRNHRRRPAPWRRPRSRRRPTPLRRSNPRALLRHDSGIFYPNYQDEIPIRVRSPRQSPMRKYASPKSRPRGATLFGPATRVSLLPVNFQAPLGLCKNLPMWVSFYIDG